MNLFGKKSPKKETYIPNDIILHICFFLKPKDVLKGVSLVCKNFHEASSSDVLWKPFVDKYTYYLEANPLNYCVKTYKELYLIKSWTFVSNKFNKNTSECILSKNMKTVEIKMKKPAFNELRILCSNECVYKGWSTIRIKYHTSQYGCWVGLISSENLEKGLKEEKVELIKYFKYFRDGSVSVQLKKGEDINRYRDINGHKDRVFFPIRENDVLTFHIDRNTSTVYCMINDDKEKQLIAKNVLELQKDLPVYLIVAGKTGQKFTILSNKKE